MDFKPKKDVPNPRETAGFFSKLLFHWTTPLFKKGLKKNLNIDDIYNVLKEDEASQLGNCMEKEWNVECEKATNNKFEPNLLKILFKIHGKFYVFLSIILIYDECLIRLAQPIFVRLLIRSFSNPGTLHHEKYVYATGVCLTTLIHIFVLHLCNFELFHIGMKARIAVSSLIFRKVLKLSKSDEQKTTVGQLINFLSNDVNQLNVIYYPAYIVAGPIQLCIATYILWKELGIACLAGVGLILIMAPVQYLLGIKSAHFRRRLNNRRDKRSKIMNEIIMGIRVIKLYAWEKPFSDVINRLRKIEIGALRNRAYVRAFYTFLSNLSYKFVLFFTLIALIIRGDLPEAEKIFFASTIFNILGLNLMQVMPTAVAAINELITSIQRIETFLKLEEKSNVINSSMKSTRESKYNHLKSDISVRIKNLDASWKPKRQTLDCINLELKPGQLILIVGPVGSGKTSLLNTILGELPAEIGSCTVNGKISYSSQEPWIFSGNIRQNILFGQTYIKNRYDQILKCCSLNPDLRHWPHEDETIVGERGVSLSGGQKARINLARALYKKADIYLMDDPLSAVDARVSRHIFDKCILKYMKGKLRVLVTHQLQYLQQADHIIVLNEGQILAQGTYRDLIEKNVDFVGLLTREDTTEKYIPKFEEMKKHIVQDNIQHPPDPTIDPIQSENKEAMMEGAVTLKNYLDYFISGDSICSTILIFSGFIMIQILSTYSDYWLSHWANDIDYHQEQIPKNCTPVHECLETIEIGNGINLWIYVGLILSLSVGYVIVPISFFRYAMQIGINMHNRMFTSVVHAPIKFFDQNSSGRIMNRFTKDLGAMDEQLPGFLYETIEIFLRNIGILILIVIANNYMFFPTVFVFIVLLLVRKYYIQTSRDLRRIEATTRSPLFTHISAAYDGLITIRALKVQNILIHQFDSHQDLSSATWYLSMATGRWFAQNLQIICVIYLVIVTFGFLTITTSSMSGSVGLAVSSALLLSGTFQYGLRQSAETENQMVSVERILEYSEIEPEANLDSEPDKKPEKEWPNKGEINFQAVSVAYSNMKVLKHLTFEIKPEEKIGIVGRTGAGKSSIASAIFRMNEPSGNIFIDGICTSNIGLHDLRRSISIIPQEPMLFSGTVRYNLDPFEEFLDEDLWKALEQVELKNSVTALDFILEDGGNNFSVGQKQLMCLARAILRNRQILILDEATANVDPRTEQLIQTTYRDVFSHCTIITIAHRLNSVMECDRILVMENGCLQEYDQPAILLQNPNGYFTSLVNQTGPSNSERLKEMAIKALHQRKGSSRQ